VWAPKALLYAAIRALWWAIGLTVLVAVALVVSLASWLGRLIARSVGYAARGDYFRKRRLAAIGRNPGRRGRYPYDRASRGSCQATGSGAGPAGEQGSPATRPRRSPTWWWQYDPRLSKGWRDARANEISDSVTPRKKWRLKTSCSGCTPMT
jgi:hypothetical protein